MAWTLHLVVWITMTASAYKCKHDFYTSSYSDYPRQEPIRIPDNRAYERMSARSADLSSASYSSMVPDDVKSAQLRLGQQTPTRTENESKVLSWKPYGESRRDQNSDKIVFPGPTADEFQLEIPEHCKRLGFCEDIPNYPKEQAKKVIAELSGLGMFQDDKMDMTNNTDVPDIAQRVGPLEENMELCQFDEKVVHPKAAVDFSGKWHIVLNQDDKPVQGFKVEICKNVSYNDGQTSEMKIREGEWQDLSPCEGFVSFQNGYQGRCKQKFVYRKMRVLRNDGSNLVESLKVPSCCSCVARLVLS